MPLSPPLSILDVLIIGAGPVGCFAAFQCSMIGLSCAVVETMESYGGQCRYLYPKKFIYDIPGHYQISGQQLADNLKQQSDRLDLNYYFGTNIKSIGGEFGNLSAIDQRGNAFMCKSIIVATGAGDMLPIKLGIGEEFEGKQLLYKIDDLEPLRGKRVAIVGGGDSALDYAVSISQISSMLTLIHRRREFKGMDSSLKEIRQLEESGKIKIITPYQIHKINSHHDKISAIQVRSIDEEHMMDIEVDYVCAFFGLQKSRSQSLIGLDSPSGPVTVDEHMMSSREGIYCIGDACHYSSKHKLILTGFSESAIASYDIRARLYGKQPVRYSTSIF